MLTKNRAWQSRSICLGMIFLIFPCTDSYTLAIEKHYSPPYRRSQATFFRFGVCMLWWKYSHFYGMVFWGNKIYVTGD